MTAKTFAREWLLYIKCAGACAFATWAYLRWVDGGPITPESTGENLMIGFVAGIFGGVALYLFLGLVRLTYWASQQADEEG